METSSAEYLAVRARIVRCAILRIETLESDIRRWNSLGGAGGQISPGATLGQIKTQLYAFTVTERDGT